MEEEFANPFINATINVLGMMAMIKPSPQKPHMKNDTKSTGDVTGIIGLAGEKAKGSFAISFSEQSILRIVSNMLGEEIKSMEDGIDDAVGEITNMISGGARAELDKMGYTFEMAIPTVITGKSHIIEHTTDHPVMVVPFETEAGPFFLEVCLIKVS